MQNLTLELDGLPENECKQIPLNCPWSITSKDESLTVTITCLKWSPNCDFCVQVTAHPQGAPNVSKQIDLDDLKLLLRSSTDALNLYEAFPEPHLNPFHFHILEELKHHDCHPPWWSWSSHRQVFWHKSQWGRRIQQIERKIIFTLGFTSWDVGDLANYTFRKKSLFSSLLRGPAAEWYENNITNANTWENVRTNFITRFSDGRNKFRYRMEVEHCIRGDGGETETFYTVSIERLIKAGSMIWTVLGPLNKKRNEQHKEGKGDKGTCTTICEDLVLDVSSGKLKSI